MDASIAVKPIFDRFQSVVITSGVSAIYSEHLVYIQGCVCGGGGDRHYSTLYTYKLGKRMLHLSYQ